MGITAGAILGLMFVYLALDAIAWVLVAAFFAMALTPPSKPWFDGASAAPERLRSCS